VRQRLDTAVHVPMSLRYTMRTQFARRSHHGHPQYKCDQCRTVPPQNLCSALHVDQLHVYFGSDCGPSNAPLNHVVTLNAMPACRASISPDSKIPVF